jgi:hypothetical protein
MHLHSNLLSNKHITGARLGVSGDVAVRQVEPFTTVKQNAVIAGVANLIGDDTLASDITLTVLTGSSASQVCTPVLLLST